MEIKIRNAEEKDFPEIIDLFKEFALFEKRPEQMINSTDSMMKDKEFFHCFVAETSDKKIIGYVSYFFCYYTWVGKSIYMDDLYVSAAYRGNGTGMKLLNKLIELAKDSGCHRLRWQVSAWNQPAITLYENLGANIDTIEKNCDLILD